jgi:hypothetical protein
MRFYHPLDCNKGCSLGNSLQLEYVTEYRKMKKSETIGN